MKNEFIKVCKIDWIKPDNIRVKEVHFKKELISCFCRNEDTRTVIKDYPVELTMMYNGCWEDFYSKLSFEEFERLMLEEGENNDNFVEVVYKIEDTDIYIEKFLNKKYVHSFEENIGSDKDYDKDTYPVFVIEHSEEENDSYYSKLSFEEFKKKMIGCEGKEKKVKINNKFKMLDI